MSRVIEKVSSRQFQKKAGLAIAVFFFLFAITGFFILPPIIKSVLTRKLSEALHREATVRKISVNPFVLSLDIAGLEIREKSGSGTFLSFDNLYLNLESISVIKGGPVLKAIRLDKPFVNIVRNDDGSYNFSDLMEDTAPKPDTPSKPFRFSFNNIEIRKGSIDFWDGPKKTKHQVRAMHVAVPFLSNLPVFVETYVQPSFEASVNNHPVAFKGTTKPFADTLETTFNVDIKGLDIPYYLAYAPFPMNFIVKSGLIDAKAVVAYTQFRDRAASIVVSGDLDLKNFVVDDKEQSPVFRLPHLGLSLAASDMTARQVHFSKILFESPELTIVRDATGLLNLETFLPQKAKTTDRPQQEKEKKDEATALKVEADGIGIKGGKLFFSDMAGARPFKTAVEAIELSVDHFSTEKDKKAGLVLSLKTESSETAGITASFSVEPMSAEGTAEVKKIAFRKYAPYYHDAVLFTVEDGTLDLSTGFRVVKAENDFETSLFSLEAAVDSLRLRKPDEKEDFLRIPVLGVKNTAIEFGKREAVIGEFFSDKGLLAVKRHADGSLNLESLTPPAKAASPVSQAGKEKAVQMDLKAKPEDKPWLITLKSLGIDGYSVRFDDAVPADPVTLHADQIRVRGNNLSTGKNRKGKASFSCLLNKTGTVSTSGTVGITPLSADLKLAVKGIEIIPFQPYFADRVKIVIGDGDISADGTMGLTYEDKTGLKVSCKGEATIAKFHSLDAINFEDFLKWQSLHFGGMDISTNPLSISMSEVALADFYSRLIINKDGTLNVQGIMESEKPAAEQKTAAADIPQPAAPATQQEAQKTVRIEKITLQGGTINFTDRHVQPEYTADLTEIGGRVTGLTSDETTAGDLDLRGTLNNYAPLEITGKLNPLREDLFVDLSADFKDMELSPVTPYSGKYIGYTIQKGKLTLALKYLIAKKKLDADNKVFLDQFTLGEEVESPDATKLPVKLAIALLKDRKGEIHLDIPVSGRIDDPKFSVFSIVIKILINLLVKAATSPFALLGAILGGGEELSYVDFDYGLTAISPEAGKKMDGLAKALADRPGLKIEVEGHVDSEKDNEGFRDYLFQKKLRTQKLKDMVKKGAQAVPVDDIKIEPAEYPVYLKAAYKEEKFPKPRNIIGIAKDLPVPEMEKLILTHIEVKEEDLRRLASERAQKVQDYFIKAGQVGPERVFLVEPKTLQPEKKENVKNSRVDFRLR